MNEFDETASLGAKHWNSVGTVCIYDRQPPREHVTNLEGEEQPRGTVGGDVSNVPAAEKQVTDE